MTKRQDMKDLFAHQDGWSQADVAAVDDLLDALKQERANIGRMWFRDSDEEWRLPRLHPTEPLHPMGTSMRGSRPRPETDRHDFFIPTRWTKEQALLVHDLLFDIANEIRMYYLGKHQRMRFVPIERYTAKANEGFVL